MSREKITRRQKSISRLVREKKQNLGGKAALSGKATLSGKAALKQKKRRKKEKQ